MTRNETLKKLFEDNNLVKDEDTYVFQRGGKKIPIIRREGIEKIQGNNNISVRFELLKCSDDNSHVVVKATATQGALVVESFGEASSKNNQNQYPVAMAEKRALSRAVLKICGFYACGVFGEDEAEDFKREA